MTDGRIPEGRKPFTDADIAALTRRLAGTAVDYKELYEAAKRDAEEAEAYAAELEAKLAKAVAFIEFLDENYRHVWGETARLKIRTLHAELKGGKDDTCR
jgi:hypothetical protein